MGSSGTPASCLTFMLKCGCVQNKRAGTPSGFAKSTTWYKCKHNNANGNNWFAGARWRTYHVTWARLWNEEKREIMKSRLVEQHWAFTPLPHSSLWRACVVSLPPFFFLFFFRLVILGTFLPGIIWIKANSFTNRVPAPSAPYSWFSLCMLSSQLYHVVFIPPVTHT